LGEEDDAAITLNACTIPCTVPNRPSIGDTDPISEM
jgi:hypothetical protein